MQRINNRIKSQVLFLRRPFENNSAVLSMLLMFGLLFILGCVCSNENGKSPEIGARDNPAQNDAKDKNTEKTKTKSELPKKLTSYELRGFTFSYYLIPSGLEREELIQTAQELHKSEPAAQLILVDEETGLDDYIKYCREISRGNTEVELPKEWVDAHLIANVQRFLDGKWYLCESNLYEKIAQLK